MSDITAATTQAGGADVESIDENERIIRSTQAMREKFITELTPGGKLPSAPEDRSMLLSLMDGATKFAIAGKKIKSDEKVAMSQQQMVTNLVEASRSMRARQSAELRKNGGQRVLDVPAREVRLVEGHTDIGTKPVSTAAVSSRSGEIFLEN